MSNKKIERPCQQCGVSFWTYSALLAKGKGKFCGRRCYEKSKVAQDEFSRRCSGCKNMKNLEEFGLRHRTAKTKGLRKSRCHSCESVASKKFDSSLRGRWSHSKSKAIKKNNADWWSIPEDDYYFLVSQPCHYCSGPLSPSGVGLDRKDNSIGYTMANVVPCCRQCNIIKNDFLSYSEMLLLVPALKQIREERMATCTL